MDIECWLLYFQGKSQGSSGNSDAKLKSCQHQESSHEKGDASTGTENVQSKKNEVTEPRKDVPPPNRCLELSEKDITFLMFYGKH